MGRLWRMIQSNLSRNWKKKWDFNVRISPVDRCTKQKEKEKKRKMIESSVRLASPVQRGHWKNESPVVCWRWGKISIPYIVCLYLHWTLNWKMFAKTRLDQAGLHWTGRHAIILFLCRLKTTQNEFWKKRKKNRKNINNEWDKYKTPKRI